MFSCCIDEYFVTRFLRLHKTNQDNKAIEDFQAQQEAGILFITGYSLNDAV